MPMMSPRTQAMAAPGSSGDQAKALFEQGLSQMAYNVLVNKLPNISPDVVTFKILDSDAEEGAGVGAFVVMRRNQTIYIPVVMAENQVKPLDVMYYKDMNVFLPLDKSWLEEVDKLALGELGTSVSAPPTLNTDVDIRNTVVPPTTGRYSYAAAQDGVHVLLDEIKNQTEPKLAFLDFLSKAPNRVKQAAARLFETRTKLLKQAVYFYGEKPLLEALTLRTEKVADYGARMSQTGALYVADKKTKPSEFKDIFGPEAPLAFSGVSIKGYFAKDTRKDLNKAVQIQRYFDLQEPKAPGVYRLWRTDGTPVLALVFDNPMALAPDRGGMGRRVPARNERIRRSGDDFSTPYSGKYVTPHSDKFVERFTGITEDGELIDCRHLLGEPLQLGDLSGSKIFKKLMSDSAAGPRTDQRGIFVQARGASFVATEPVDIVAVSDLSDGLRHIEVRCNYEPKTLVIDKKSPNSKIMVPQHSKLVHLPNNFVWLAAKSATDSHEAKEDRRSKLKSVYARPYVRPLGEEDFLTSPEDIFRWAAEGAVKEGAEKITVRRSAHGFTFGVAPKEAFEFVPALRKLATEAGICVEDAEVALKLADERGAFDFWILPEANYAKVAAYLKTAADDGSKPPSGGGDPAAQDPAAGGAPMDPAQAAMMGVQGAPMAPAAPAPVDMAVAEAMQNLMMQQQGLQSQMTLLQQIQQRTNMIAGGGGAMGSPAAAAAAMGGPMDPSMMGGGAAPMQPGPGGAPPAGGAPGMAPPAAPGAQGAMGAPGGVQSAPGMAMQQGGGPQAAPGGGMQPGMDPSQQGMQQPPPPAMMNADDGSVEGVMNQVNPQFMEQAGQLNDAGAFDAAALSSMAQTPALKDLVGAYVPNLEKSLDNIGRVLLSLWMDESNIKQDIGAEAYVNLEDNLRTVFRGLGDLILKINQSSAILRGPNDLAPMEH